MADADANNWAKLQILLNLATTTLRELFKTLWTVKTGSNWDEKDGNALLNMNLKNVGKEQQKTIGKGDVDEWDITTLRSILCAEDFLDLSGVQKEGVAGIVDIRNKVNHLPNNALTKQQFDEWWGALHGILIDLGVTETDLEQLKQERLVDGVEFIPATERTAIGPNRVEATQLKKEANQAFKNGNYTLACELYSKGIKLPGVPTSDRAVLFSNRCAAYLKQYELSRDKTYLETAKDDAKLAVKLQPDWWRGIFRLGQVYVASRKFREAILNFTNAFAKEPQRQKIADALSNAKLRLGEDNRMDFLDPHNARISTADIVRNVNKRGKLNISLTAWRDEIEKYDGRDICRQGHKHRFGTDGFTRDYELAARYYKDAADRGIAEGLYNLGEITLNEEGVKQDFVLGLKLLKEAAESPPFVEGAPNIGVSNAQHLLGMCYKEGIGVTKNITEAKYWFQRGSDNGCPHSANNLAIIYECESIDEKHDLIKAEQYYRLAASNVFFPNADAMANLARLYYATGDLQKALDWCHQAQETGNKHSKLFTLTSLIQKLLDDFNQSNVLVWEYVNDLSIDGLTVQQRKDRYCIAHNIPVLNFAECKSKFIPFTLHNICTDDYDLLKFQNCAKQSTYGRKLWTARIHLMAAMQVMTEKIIDRKSPSMESYKRFVKDLSLAVQLDDRIDLPSTYIFKAEVVINHLLKHKLPFDEDVRICYVAFHASKDPAECIIFLNDCVSKYPRNIFFLETRVCMYLALNRFEESLRDTKLALKLDPKNVDILADHADVMMIPGDKFEPNDIIEAYNNFLQVAPKDHRKVPEAYYAIALVMWTNEKFWKQQLATMTVEEHIAEIGKYYNLGLEAEKQQLSIFLPYKSGVKEQLENFFPVIVKLWPSCSRLFSCEEPDKELKRTQLSEKLTDPNRIMKVKRHRQSIQRRTLRKVDSCDVRIAFSVKTPQKQMMPETMNDLRPILLWDMDPLEDCVYKGRVLAVTVIDELILTGSSICVLLEDSNGCVERSFIYNSPHMADETEAQRVFGVGCKMSIINPYRRICAVDHKPAIRVDDPDSIIFEGFIPNMCRYCVKPNAGNKCASCRVAVYCNRKCQKLDWKVMGHKLVCKPTEKNL